jgi:hypothetical protein
MSFLFYSTLERKAKEKSGIAGIVWMEDWDVWLDRVMSWKSWKDHAGWCES